MVSTPSDKDGKSGGGRRGTEGQRVAERKREREISFHTVIN